MRTNWVPAVTDGLAEDREVILFNNAGVSSRSDEVPTVGHFVGSPFDCAAGGRSEALADQFLAPGPERLGVLRIEGVGPDAGAHRADQPFGDL